ncbi:hypothetical protein Vafri_12844 [Volvox africanus]|uniref:Uncharacterized protein n=1 Tax=Volvox africanus TaxID=51714 RepID=A0A8J4F4X1_9CHLO|nr:hypothetical protein Vafri_12844 [Volvox africanus]
MGIQPAEGRWDVVVAALWQRPADLTGLASARYPVTLAIMLWARSTLGRVVITCLVTAVGCRWSGWTGHWGRTSCRGAHSQSGARVRYDCQQGAGAPATSLGDGCCRNVGGARKRSKERMWDVL